MTPLEKFQKAIDNCNHKNGCDYYCTKKEQENCQKLLEHKKRMQNCRERGLPIEYW